MKNFKGKVIYNPSGKAGEYSYWAANLYNGCSARCDYCYNRKGIVKSVLGGDLPTLKKCLINEETAFDIFSNEMFKNETELRKHGLFFNFVSDPFLPETSELNLRCMRLCVWNDIPVKVLTKQTWWVNHFLNSLEDDARTYNKKHLYAFGFTLTGHDELEPGAATNTDRIRAMKVLSMEGFKTWASIEPIVDFMSARTMIKQSFGYCDLYKIGLMSGKKYDVVEAQTFVEWLDGLIDSNYPKFYLKESLQKLTHYTNEELEVNFVNRDFNLHDAN